METICARAEPVRVAVSANTAIDRHTFFMVFPLFQNVSQDMVSVLSFFLRGMAQSHVRLPAAGRPRVKREGKISSSKRSWAQDLTPDVAWPWRWPGWARTATPNKEPLATLAQRKHPSAWAGYFSMFRRDKKSGLHSRFRDDEFLLRSPRHPS